MNFTMYTWAYSKYRLYHCPPKKDAWDAFFKMYGVPYLCFAVSRPKAAFL